MLLIPTGLDRTELRRTPIVTFALLALSFAVFLATSSRSGQRQVGHDRAEAVVDYLLDHPYLDPPQELVPLMSPELVDQLAEARAEYLHRTSPPVPMVVNAQRLKLGELVRALQETSLDAGPGRWGFVPAHPSFSSAVSSLFVHGGWLHLLGNLLFLWIAGPFLEDAYGRLLFALLYLASGIAAAYLHAFLHPHSLVPLIGASGAISGVMGAFLVRLGRAKVRFVFLPIPIFWFLRFRFFVPAFVVLPLWLLEQLLNVPNDESAGVAFWAHVGGFVFGAAVAVGLKLGKVEERWVDPGIEKEISWSVDPALARASDARTAGDLPAARLAVDQVLRRSPGDIAAVRLAYEIALDGHDGEEIARRATRLLEVYAQKGERDLAFSLLGEAPVVAGTLPPRFHLAAGTLVERDGDAASALEWYRDAVRSSTGDPAELRALTRIAALEKARGNRTAAREALTAAARHPACDDVWRRQLDAALAGV